MTTTPPGGGSLPGDGPWVERWLSPPRFAVYLTAAHGDRARALALYRWNTRLSAALLHDLAHVEVGLRNAYDEALSAHWPGPQPWVFHGPVVLAPLFRTRGKRRVDVNQRPRENLDRAIRDAGGTNSPPGKVVAELMFGFWRYLSSAAHEKALWVPALHRAFPPGTDRARDVDGPVGRIQQLRNRVAHHEHLLTTDLLARINDIDHVATLIAPELGALVRTTSTVPTLMSERP